MAVKIMDKEFTIRKSTDKDYRFVYNLLKKNMYSLFVRHWGGWNPRVFRDHFNKKNITIIEYKTKRVAFYELEFMKNFSYISNVQVSTLMQGKGLGTFLMNLLEKETERAGLRKIRLRVFKDNPARNFYLKLGYQQITDETSDVILEKKL